MNDVAIRVEGLGKRYRLGQRQRYRALRDLLGDALRAPSRLLRPNGAGRNGQPQHIWALKDVTFAVRQGEVFGLVGRNGAGKTTLLKILARVTRPTTGHAEVHGRMGTLLEVGTGFHPELSGRENVFLSGAILGMSRREILRKFDEIVAFAEVEKFIDTPLKHYSTGMQMRLAFAVAAHLEPEILLIDEVLAVGDLEFQKKCLGKMSEVARGGRTILFVSHQLNQIRRLCGTVIWVDAGTIRQMGPTAQVVGAYEAAMTSGQWGSRAREDGPTVKARFLGWEIAEPRNSRPNVLETHGPLTVRFRVEVNQPMRNVHHGVALFNSDNQLMWAWSASNLQLVPGLHYICYRFPGLPLRPAIYSWQVSLWDDDGQVDLWNCSPEMIIATENYQHALDEWNGVLNVPCSFEVNQPL